MNHSALKKFAQGARRKLIAQVGLRLDYVLDHDDAYLRSHGKEKRKINELIEKKGRDRVIEDTAYVWFNRLTALRYMDLKGYNRIGIVSPAPGESRPHILAEIKRGAVPEEIAFASEEILDYINGRVESPEPDREAYKTALLSWCNHIGRIMPFLFKPVDDWAALLLPRDLLSEESIIADIQRNLTGDSCVDVEIIGWLYQYYISEKKNEVFDGLKKNKKITPENIPAATQLFTPHWIVRYLAENSLGRLWLLNRPDSRLIDEMEYYIPEEGGGSGQWPVDSGQGGSGQWSVASGQLGRTGDGEELQGSDRVAEGDGSGGRGVSANKAISEGGTLFTDKPGSSSGGIGSFEHRGGAGEEFHSGVQEFSLHSPGVPGGGRDPASPGGSTVVPDGTEGPTGSEHAGGNQQNADIPQQEANHWPLTTGHLPLDSPEDIRLCDPACGSGHMLTYAFDLLYRIYEEEGYAPAEIPNLILTKNLYGIEIDERAGELAAFALAMKARERDRRFLEHPVQPHIRVLENVDLAVRGNRAAQGDLFDAPDPDAIQRDRDDIVELLCGDDVSRRDLVHDLELFSEADNFGSLLRPALSWQDIVKALERLDGYEKHLSAPTFVQRELIDGCRTALAQAGYLTQRYHVVIANPPYMGGKGMNGRLSSWAKEKYPDSKSDLFAMFIERNLELSIRGGSVAMITMQSWMFLSSFEKLRNTILSDHTILSMAHLGARAFDSIGGEVVSTTSFVLEHGHRKNFKGGFVRLVDGGNEAEKDAMLRETIEKLKN